MTQVTAATAMTNDAAADQALLDSLLDSLEGEDDSVTLEAADEVIEDEQQLAGEVVSAAIDATSTIDADAALLAEIEAAAELDVTKQALYAEQGDEMVADATPPATDPEAVADAGEKKGKGKGGRKKKVAAEGEGAEPAPAEPKEPKAPRATSVTHKPGDLLVAKLGERAADFLVFDSTLDEASIEASRAAFIERMNDREAIADKVREKMIMFMVWMSKGGSLNEVIKRALTVLHAEGQLTSGDKGNLQLNLLSKPYSVGTARSQANQMFMALPELGMTIKEKGRMVPNPNSPLLIGAYAALGLE